ncbi:hypothetical protein C7G41_08570 [Bradyrhizobium sp. MOS002]|nr:hypothetical protein C7G41_08570 [Bradyrhizobium sp. MOS002]
MLIPISAPAAKPGRGAHRSDVGRPPRAFAGAQWSAGAEWYWTRTANSRCRRYPTPGCHRSAAYRAAHITAPRQKLKARRP